VKRFDLPGSNRSGATFTASVLCLIGAAMAFGCATVRPANVLPPEAIETPAVEIVEAIAPELPMIRIQSMDDTHVYFELRNETTEPFHFSMQFDNFMAVTESFEEGQWRRHLSFHCGTGSVPTSIDPGESITGSAYRNSTEFPVRVRLGIRRGPAPESGPLFYNWIYLTSGSSAYFSEQ
jgi:hypothetical protein